MISAMDKSRETGYFSQEPYPVDNIKCIGKDCLHSLPAPDRNNNVVLATYAADFGSFIVPILLIVLLFRPVYHKLYKNLKMSLFSCSHDNVFCGL